MCVFSLPWSRFLDVAQRFPKTTAADIQTTFLSHCPCSLFAVHSTDQSHTRKSESRKVSHENVDVADNLATVSDHVDGDTK